MDLYKLSQACHFQFYLEHSTEATNAEFGENIFPSLISSYFTAIQEILGKTNKRIFCFYVDFYCPF